MALDLTHPLLPLAHQQLTPHAHLKFYSQSTPQPYS
jgi:hypothetical protein